MFYDVYSRLCEENHEDEYAVPLKVGYKSNSVVAQWADGSVPRGKYLKALADHFNVSVSYLLDIEEKPSTAEGEGLLDAELVRDLLQLTPAEAGKVRAFVKGLLAGREV